MTKAPEKHVIHIFLRPDEYQVFKEEAQEKGLRPTGLARSLLVQHINERAEYVQLKKEYIGDAQ